MDRYIGRMLDDRYEILEVLGTGGMAVVYKAKCHRLNRMVAIKILRDENMQDDDFRRRFHAEGQAVGMLSHPNIVSVYDVSSVDGVDYIVMELVDGITLKQYMERKGVLNWKETLHFATQIAKALDHAHSRGLVHRDIKPHNVMVLKNGSVRVTDFGIARIMSKSNTLTKEALGSVHYISPEQARGGRVDHRSDLYSLGVVMYEMITGRPPYDGESPVSVAIQHIAGGAPKPSTLNPNMPAGLEQIIQHAMANALKDRYETAMDMIADMDALRKDPGTEFPTVTVKPAVQNKPKPVQEEVPSQKPFRKERKPRDYMDAELGKGRAATIAVVSCCVVAMVAVVIFLVMLASGGIFQNETVTYEVPKLINLPFDKLPKYEGLNIVKQGQGVYSDEVPAGHIIEQLPAEGTVVEAGRTVFVIVSLGPKPADVTMPNLIGRSRADALAILKGLNLELKTEIKEVYHDTVEAGVVIDVNIKEGTALYAGQKIVLTVSLGVEAEFEIMPNLMRDGIDKVRAETLLAVRGFKNVTWVPVESVLPEGTIVNQSVASGEYIDITTPIVIEYSNGVRPEVTLEYTFDLSDVRTQMNIAPEESYTLTIMCGDQIIVQSVTIEPEQNSYTVSLTGREPVDCIIYINLLYYTTVTVDFA